jgi:hypothetical protein
MRVPMRVPETAHACVFEHYRRSQKQPLGDVLVNGESLVRTIRPKAYRLRVDPLSCKNLRQLDNLCLALASVGFHVVEFAFVHSLFNRDAVRVDVTPTQRSAEIF